MPCHDAICRGSYHRLQLQSSCSLFLPGQKDQRCCFRRRWGKLPGVSVRVKGTSGGTLTAADGSFSLQLPDGPVTLVFSFTGYQPHEVNVAGSAPLNIILQPAAGELNEVVAVGYGQQKKTSLTGSVASLDQKALANRPITNSSQVLQGLPGVYVNQVQGRPGADG